MRRATVKKGQPSVQLAREVFRERFYARFYDPAFEKINQSLEQVEQTAWEAYRDYRRSPRSRKAGRGFYDPDFSLPIEWLETKRRLQLAEKKQKNRRGRSRILLICASPRSDQTCPGEISKTYRLVMLARQVIQREKFEVDLLDLSRLASEYGRVIFPCKACVSTAMPLCNWPCSCYPNHAMGQTGDWMAEIYEKWVAAHGVMIITPVHWYQAPSVLKLMIDRLVCADGGNPDPTLTEGKNPLRAKEVELKGWHYPKHLAGRAFSVVVHGDAEGVGTLRRILTDWLTDMKLVPAGPSALLGKYIGYYEPYATSHQELERAADFLAEVQNAASSLVKTVRLIRTGKFPNPDQHLKDPRPK